MLRGFFSSLALQMILYYIHLKQGVTLEVEAFQVQCIKILVLQNQKLRGLLVSAGSCLGHNRIMLTSRAQTSSTKLGRVVPLFMFYKFIKFLYLLYKFNCISDAVINQQEIFQRQKGCCRVFVLLETACAGQRQNVRNLC